MGVHHIALATKDMAATHDFYTQAMGFELVKGVVGPTGHSGGWSKHLFYAIPGGGQLAFWELHDTSLGDDWQTAISTGCGLPWWVNHLAFEAELDQLRSLGERWLKWGTEVLRIDHDFVVSIYTRDPNGNSVEWCANRRAYTDADKAAARHILQATEPEVEGTQSIRGMWKPDKYHPKAIPLTQE